MRLPRDAEPEALPDDLPDLRAVRALRRRLLGLIPHPAQDRAGPDGAARHPLPRPHQYFQHCSVRRQYFMIFTIRTQMLNQAMVTDGQAVKA